jgi:hypothetical protein
MIGQKNIIPGILLTGAAATYYTAPALTRVRICNATLTNDSGGAVACTVNIVTSGDTAALKNRKISARSIADGETYTCPELIGRILEPGDFISALGLNVALDVSAFTQV